ncbi:MAG: cellulase family glycosylhydrolase, partial [Paludibacteraceae bacterium]|nr:cellulase family glycosylhydrolase [Paludibacteraceae bacterium]
FYAGSHKEYLRQKAQTALNNGIALFVTEFGTSHASGDKDYSPEETKTWIKWLNERKISWACWSYADKNEVSSSLISGSCRDRKWNNTSESGTLIKNLLKEDLIKFEACDGSSDAVQGDGGQNDNNQNEDDGNDDNNQSGDGSNDNNQGNVDDDEEVSGNISYPKLADLVASGNVYRIVNKKSGKVITTEGDLLVQKPRDEKDSRQLFKAVADGDFVLFSSAEQENMTNKYNPNDNAEILLQAPSSYDDPSEKWSVTKVAENVWFRIQNKSTNNTTSCIEANEESGDKVRQASWKSDDAQMWGFELVDAKDGGTYSELYENDEWTIIPTLVDDKFIVVGDGFDEVSIVSVSGVVQKEFVVSSSYDMAGLPSGMYFIYLKNSGAVVKRFSVLKK